MKMQAKHSQQQAGTVFLQTFRRVGISVLIPLLFFSFCIITLQTTQSVRRLESANLNVLSREDQIVSTLMESLDQSILTLAQNPTAISFAVTPHEENAQRNATLCTYLKNLSNTYPFIIDASLISHFQDLQLSSSGIRRDVDHKWIQCIEEGTILPNGIGVWITPRGTSHDLYLFRHVPYGSASELTAVYLRIDLQAFLNQVTESSGEKTDTETRFICDSNGTLLLSSDGHSLATYKILSSADTHKDDYSIHMLGGIPYVCSRYTNHTLGWTYYYATPAILSSNYFSGIALPILLCILTAFGIGLLLSYQGAKELYRPLEKLVSTLPQPTSADNCVQDEYQRLAEYYGELLNRKDEVYKQAQTIKPLLRENFLISLLNKPALPLDEILHRMRLLELPTDLSRFCAVMLQIDHYHDLTYSPETMQEIKKQLRTLFSTSSDSVLACFSAEISSETFLIICDNQVDDTDTAAKWAIHTLAQQLQELVKSSWAISVTIGIGQIYHELKDLPTTCREAQHALTYKLYQGTGCLIQYSDISDSSSRHYPVSFEKMQQLLNSTRSGDEKSTLQQLQNLFHSFGDEQKYPPEKLQEVFRSLTASLVEIIRSSDIPLEAVTTEDIENRLLQKRTLADIEPWLTDLYCRTAAAIRSARSDRIQNNAEIIKQYIDENLTKDISLTSISEFVGYSSTYVSRIFRQQYGVSFLDYLNSERVTIAKELLATTNLSVKEIGFQVGFNNLQTFFRIFKKHTNMTPLQFRESLPTP